MRLIDADTLPFERYGEDVISWYATGWNDAINVIDRAPTVDAEPVRHGEWIFGEVGPVGQSVKCSECGWGCESVSMITWMRYKGHKHCGNCGAKMY